MSSCFLLISRNIVVFCNITSRLLQGLLMMLKFAPMMWTGLIGGD